MGRETQLRAAREMLGQFVRGIDIPHFYVETHMDNSLNEQLEREALTAANIANLRAIGEGQIDLDEIELRFEHDR